MKNSQPIAVYFVQRQLDMWVIISICLCFFFWIPSILFAFWFIFFREKEDASAAAA